ncbi:MAG: FtsQ-type POTRA domain-containing protein [Chloroflexota bacterium]
MSDKELTRAEQVRVRRESNSARRMERVIKDVTRAVPMVTTRTKQSGAASNRKPARNTRRRFQIALPIARDDMRPLSVPRPRFGMRALSFTIVALLATALYLAYNLPQFRATQAQVTGNRLISPLEVNSVMNVAGQPIFLLKPEDLETRLRLNFPELVAVKVTISLPNLISVALSERKPVVRWQQGDGYTWIGDDGVAFRPRADIAELISVVAVSGPPVEETVSTDPFSPAPFISPELIRTLQGLAGHVPPGMSILYDANFGFGWDDPRGWRVYFGTSSSDVELKMRVYESMVNSLTQRGIRPALINVRYPTAPYYRMGQ